MSHTFAPHTFAPNTYSCHWDRQNRQWQIISRSGHIVYEADDEQLVKLVCAQINDPIDVQVAGSRPYVASPRPPRPKTKPRFSAEMTGWPVLCTALGLLLATVLLLAPDRKPSQASPRETAYQAVSPPRALPQYSAAQALPAQGPPVAYREVWETEMQERRYTVARPVTQTIQRVERFKQLRPVWETQPREEAYTVMRPVEETSLRYEKVTVPTPVTTYTTSYVDQGHWAERTTPVTSGGSTRLRWISGGWTTDSLTGLQYYRLPMLLPAKTPEVVTQQTSRVWQPNVAPMQIPQTTLTSRVETRAVPEKAVRYVAERRVRTVPTRVCRMVEEEQTRSVPVTVCRTVYEERVEKVPVRVCRRVPVVGAAPSQNAAPQNGPWQTAPLQDVQPQNAAPQDTTIDPVHAPSQTAPQAPAQTSPRSFRRSYDADQVVMAR